MRKKIIIVLILALLLAGPVLAHAAPRVHHLWLMVNDTAWILCSGEIQVEQLGAQSAKVWCEP